MPERSNGAVLKTVGPSGAPGFESQSRRLDRRRFAATPRHTPVTEGCSGTVVRRDRGVGEEVLLARIETETARGPGRHRATRAVRPRDSSAKNGSAPLPCYSPGRSRGQAARGSSGREGGNARKTRSRHRARAQAPGRLCVRRAAKGGRKMSTSRRSLPGSCRAAAMVVAAAIPVIWASLAITASGSPNPSRRSGARCEVQQQ